MDKLAQQVQGLLFAEGGALTYKALEKTLQCDGIALTHALDSLSQKLEGTGLSLVRSDTEATLAITADARELVAKKAAEEYQSSIGEAGLEVLAVLLYEGSSTRATIDYIRGVNSSSSLRNLLSRGLVERSGNPEDNREYMYRATTELLAHLGVGKRDNLPEYGTISHELSAFKATQNHGATDTINGSESE